MKAKEIQAGRWYETTLGVGECLVVQPSKPPSMKFNITLPFPRGIVYLAPRDVIREIAKPEV